MKPLHSANHRIKHSLAQTVALAREQDEIYRQQLQQYNINFGNAVVTNTAGDAIHRFQFIEPVRWNGTNGTALTARWGDWNNTTAPLRVQEIQFTVPMTEGITDGDL